LTIHKCNICKNDIEDTIFEPGSTHIGNGKQIDVCKKCLDKMFVKHKEIGDITIEYKKQIKITDKWYFDELKRLILGDKQ